MYFVVCFLFCSGGGLVKQFKVIFGGVRNNLGVGWKNNGIFMKPDL